MSMNQFLPPLLQAIQQLLHTPGGHVAFHELVKGGYEHAKVGIEGLREEMQNHPKTGPAAAAIGLAQPLTQLPAGGVQPQTAGSGSSGLRGSDPLGLGSRDEALAFVDHCQAAIAELEQMQVHIGNADETLSLPCVGCGEPIAVGSGQFTCARCKTTIGLVSCSRCGELLKTFGSDAGVCQVCGHLNKANLMSPSREQLAERIRSALAHLRGLRDTYLKQLTHPWTAIRS